VLNGDVKDENIGILAKYLHGRGIPLRRVEIVSDVVDEIVESTQRLRAKHDLIFTTGGIGPTHDDCTYEALAKAYDRKVVLHEETRDKMKALHPEKELTPERLRMATLPERCRVIYPYEKSWVPVVVLEEQCYIFPGIPKLFSRLLLSMDDASFLPRGAPIFKRYVWTNKMESEISTPLAELQRVYPSVQIGSYPEFDAVAHNVRLSIRSIDQQLAAEVCERVRAVVDGFYLDQSNDSSSSFFND